MIIKPGDSSASLRATSERPSKLAKKVEAGVRANSDSVTLSAEAQRVAAEKATAAETTTSGRAILLSRLFHTNDINAQPKVETTVTIYNMNGSVYSYLNHDDRAMLSKAYEYARDNGIDPVSVDNLAFDLGFYRMKIPTGGSPDLTSSSWDSKTGQLLISEFTTEDETLSRSILSTQAMSDTKIEHDFLQAVLHPGRTPKHAVDFNFLRDVVLAFSPSHSDGAVDPTVSFADRDARLELAKTAKAMQSFSPAGAGAQSKVGANDGKEIMKSRLFGVTSHESGTKRHRFTEYLSGDDKNMLGDLYANAEANGVDLKEVDKLAEALGALRKSEAMLHEQGQLAPEVVLLLGKTREPHQNALDSGKLRDTTAKR